MFRLIDRLLILNYLKSYLICLVSLLSLFIIVDLFNNIDDFAKVKGGFVPLIKHIGVYYGVEITFIFDRLSEAIALLAAMFTIAWIQRNNELLPILSAGISTRRVLRPVLFSAGLLILINVANQEFLIPSIGGTKVVRGDPKQEQILFVNGSYDRHNIHITGIRAIRKDLLVQNMTCTVPATVADGKIFSLQAEEAVYVPPQNRIRTGGWLLSKTKPAELSQWTRDDILEPIDPGKYFLYTDVDFDRLTRNRSWFQYESTWNIYQVLQHTDSPRLASIAVFFHMRLTRPVLGMLLVIMGLSVILRDQNRNVYISIGFCIVLCGVFYAVTIMAKYFGDREILSPALAAWFPVFIFGPIAFALFDAVHT